MGLFKKYFKHPGPQAASRPRAAWNECVRRPRAEIQDPALRPRGFAHD